MLAWTQMAALVSLRLQDRIPAVAETHRFILCTRPSGGTAHEGGACDQSIGTTVSNIITAIIFNWDIPHVNCLCISRVYSSCWVSLYAEYIPHVEYLCMQSIFLMFTVYMNLLAYRSLPPHPTPIYPNIVTHDTPTNQLPQEPYCAVSTLNLICKLPVPCLCCTLTIYEVQQIHRNRFDTPWGYVFHIY